MFGLIHVTMPSVVARYAIADARDSTYSRRAWVSAAARSASSRSLTSRKLVM